MYCKHLASYIARVQVTVFDEQNCHIYISHFKTLTA